MIKGQWNAHISGLQSRSTRENIPLSCNIEGESAPPEPDATPIEKKMRQVHRWVDTEDDEAGANRQTTSLAALALTLLLVVASFALVQQLRYKATVEDCLLSGRTNCGVSIPIQ